MATVADETKPARQRRGQAGKTGRKDAEYIDLGPSRGRQTMMPQTLWKDMCKKAIDEDTTVSALMVRFCTQGMVRAGYDYRAKGVSAIQAGEVNNSGETDPVTETLTPSEPTIEATDPGAGEGSEQVAAQPRASRRRQAGSS